MVARAAFRHDGVMNFGMLLYPNLTQLDLTGPFEVLHRVPGATVHLVWKDTRPVRAESGLAIVPTSRSFLSRM